MTQSAKKKKSITDIKARLVGRIMKAFRPNTYTLESQHWNKAIEAMLSLPVSKLRMLETIAMGKRNEVIHFDSNLPEDFKLRYPCPKNQQMDQIIYLRDRVVPNLYSCWKTGDIPNLKIAIQEIEIIIRNVENTVKQQLWDNLK